MPQHFKICIEICIQIEIHLSSDLRVTLFEEDVTAAKDQQSSTEIAVRPANNGKQLRLMISSNPIKKPHQRRAAIVLESTSTVSLEDFIILIRTKKNLLTTTKRIPEYPVLFTKKKSYKRRPPKHLLSKHQAFFFVRMPSYRSTSSIHYLPRLINRGKYRTRTKSN